MFEPIRGGTRGGQAEFKWSDVSADKDREVCLQRGLLILRIDNTLPFRTISATASTRPLVDGRKTRISIGIIVISKTQRMSAPRKYVKSRKWKRKRSPLLCEPH